jgi:glyoxylase-like metal-dependent hydrolase (beta-lactamase superfamily II)
MKIAEDVYLAGSGLVGCSYSHDYDCNVYAVRCGDEYLLIDSGVGHETHRLAENLGFDGVPSSALRRLLLTHCHLDHSGGAHWFRENYGLEVCASVETASALEGGDEEANSLAAAKRAGVYPEDFHLEACKVDRVFQGGERISVSDAVIEVLRTPGHSRDMMSYLIHKPGRLLLFSGDTIFHGGKILLSDIYDCDVPAYCHSLRALAQYKIDALFPGHQMWVLRDANLHLRKAMEFLEQLLLPPNLL